MMEDEIKVIHIRAAAMSSMRSALRRALLTPMVCSVLASTGIFGGISALFVGIVSVILHGVIAGDRIFDRVGTGLLIAAIPMILIGSVFLDEIQIKK
jgi:hypothetical protein